MPPNGFYAIELPPCVAVGCRLSHEVHVELVEPPDGVGAGAAAEPLPHDPAAVEQVLADQRLLVVQVLPVNKHSGTEIIIALQ